jgi:hypothetical protein
VSSEKGSAMKRLWVAGFPACLVPGVVAAQRARPRSFAPVVLNFPQCQRTQKWLTTLSEGTDIAFGRCRRTGVQAGGINVFEAGKECLPAAIVCARDAIRRTMSAGSKLTDAASAEAAKVAH